MPDQPETAARARALAYAAALALPAVLWHGGAISGLGAGIIVVAACGAILAARRERHAIERRAALRIAEATRAAAARARAAEAASRAATAALDTLPDAIVELDDRQRVVRANGAARSLLNAAPGAPLLSLIRDPDILASVEDVLAGRETTRVGYAPPGPIERHFEATVLGIDPGTASRPGALLVLRDVTALRRVDRMRADFVANVSHELRTPLAAVAGFIETLLGPARDDPPARDRFLRIMDTEARRMTRLLADLLSLSRIEASEHAAPTDIVALAPILRRVVEALEPGAAAKGIRIALDLPADLPAVIGDADQLQQVAQNLVDNAIKYGRANTRVELAARVGLRKADHVAQVEFSVRDQGEGIAAPHLARLTERFYRVDAGRSRRLGGTGLGLAIVKHIVNRHRGQLTIASVVGQGSVFTVHLPAVGQR